MTRWMVIVTGEGKRPTDEQVAKMFLNRPGLSVTVMSTTDERILYVAKPVKRRKYGKL